MTWQLTRMRWWMTRQQERLAMRIAWHLPRWLIYWAVIRCWAHGTTGEYGTTEPDKLGWSEALKRWQALDPHLG
jgi:hypothetical protein